MATPTFAADIRPLFRQVDIDHMKPFNVFLDDVTWMTDAGAGAVGNSPQYPDHGNARAVFSYLTGETQPQMPIGAPPWSADQLATYQAWMDGGFQP